ncbi:uncharacterized protein PFL1_04506 [Pseudozyma flocculosa PF-1]|uniref:SET domain-containing protein n=2 Tax=Pseudozyma flocculosa TaxID=84751 RepID=A0A5C3FCJ1_9BASI|nr:uncharacterized protein PFL1_04506 [Pseudozyma flocculosa PF-1]EPQ28179.1 hypothetical protein PFL1_04506 [Pseudozyma flocculosa PF-1]SPO41980.1 uncharacterized protein PSFLO_07463 [Pseudozyma flocculosa]
MTSVYTGHLSAGDGLAAAATHVPTHPSLIQVEFANGSYNSRLVSLVSLKRDEVLTTFAPHVTAAPRPSYSTVQVAEDAHIELNSDLLYCNHSCDPNVRFVVAGDDKRQWKAVAEKDIKKGDTLTFFYPSTEWSMAQPFDCACNCGQQCLGKISGAASIPASVLGRYFVNPHILRLKRDQIRQQNGGSADTQDEQALFRRNDRP